MQLNTARSIIQAAEIQGNGGWTDFLSSIIQKYNTRKVCLPAIDIKTIMFIIN